MDGGGISEGEMEEAEGTRRLSLGGVGREHVEHKETAESSGARGGGHVEMASPVRARGGDPRARGGAWVE